MEFPEQNDLKILPFTKLYFGEGFAEALSTKLKEKENTCFRKQSCNHLNVQSLFSPF